MSTQIIAVLCEGPHDVAFLNRILKADGYTQHERVKLSEYPAPINQFLIQRAQEADVENLNLQEVRRKLLPAHVLKKEEKFLFLFSLGGDSKKDSRQSLLKKFQAFVPAPASGKFVIPGTESTQFGVLYFFDADDQGVSNRLAEINQELAESLGIDPADGLSANEEVKIIGGLKIGGYIFSQSGSDTGKLEDILVPLMEGGNESIFQAATDFLDKHHDPGRLKKLKFRIQNDGTVVEKRDGKHKYDEKKSLIGTVGQLQLSGKSNTVCIDDSDYLNLLKIQGDIHCQAITKFFANATV